MDTNRLKRFATEARNILMQGVAHRFTALGFLPDGNVTEEPLPMGGGATFMGDTVSEDFYQKWYSLQRAVKAHSIEEVAEEAAYTWFNRMVAIRIMVKNGLIAPVLQYESDGVHIPLLVSEARQGRMPDMNVDDQRKLEDLLLDDSKTDEQFRILIVAFCHANPVINSCFGHISDYTELLLPTNILAEGGFVDMLNNTEFISEEDYHSPELIGWLYQFYISEKKDDVFASFKKGKKAEAKDIPAATQIFTPNWIVKYMVQNTIGRIYLDNNPYEEDVQKNWKYLVEPSEPTPKENILHYDDLKELKFADLASGSGHILNEGFDMLYDLYVLEGYSRSQAIENIFRYNLTGVDIDTRAKQLAQFALLLKACQKDSSFADAHIIPRVLDMPEPYPYKDNLRDTLPHFFLGGNQEMTQEVCDAIDLMDQAKNLGSIMKFKISERTRNAIMIRMEEYEEQPTYSDEFEQLKVRMRIILALTEKYSALVMNPPYMGASNMNPILSEYVKKYYTDGKADLMTVFMLLAEEKTQEQGKYAMINLPSWLFLSTFENLRRNMVEKYHIDSLLHMGRGIFGIDWGSVAFTISKKSNNCKGLYFRLHKRNFQHIYYYHIEQLFLRALHQKSFKYNFDEYRDDSGVDSTFEHSEDGEQLYYEAIQNDFLIIPGCPIGYWVSDSILNLFNNPSVGSRTETRLGMATADNNKFLRLFWEVDSKNVFLSCNSTLESEESSLTWYPYAKGGEFHKWYGNNEYLVNWKYNGVEIRSFADSNGKIRSHNYNLDYIFKKGITWNALSSGNTSFRVMNNSLFDNAGSSLFSNDNDYYNILGYLNSNLFRHLVPIINPTFNFQPGTISSVPYITIGIEEIVKQCIDISKLDWDAHETSWDFQCNELLTMDEQVLFDNLDYIIDKHYKETGEHICIDPAAPQPESVEWCYDTYCTKWERLFMQLHENEEELNRQFIDIYGLQDELTPDVPLEEITILQQGEIKIENGELKWNADVLMKQLINYAVGCLMGRYSIDKPGLILANQGDGLEQYYEQVPDSRFEPDDDGIIPLMSAQSDFADNATVRFKQWLVAAFGEETLVENLNFIEKCLGKSIDDYFVKDFWKDHKKMYQNRPIYWLFSSKKGAFQCLAYMHRMDAYTAERIRTKYLLPHIEWLMQKQSEMEANAANLNARERKELDNIGKQIEECREYHDRLHVIADEQIAFDLDDGVVVNYAKFGDVLSKLK